MQQSLELSRKDSNIKNKYTFIGHLTAYDHTTLKQLFSYDDLSLVIPFA